MKARLVIIFILIMKNGGQVEKEINNTKFWMELDEYPPEAGNNSFMVHADIKSGLTCSLK